jgi:hypothetical protein
VLHRPSPVAKMNLPVDPVLMTGKCFWYVPHENSLIIVNFGFTYEDFGFD